MLAKVAQKPTPYPQYIRRVSEIGINGTSNHLNPLWHYHLQIAGQRKIVHLKPITAQAWSVVKTLLNKKNRPLILPYIRPHIWVYQHPISALHLASSSGSVARHIQILCPINKFICLLFQTTLGLTQLFPNGGRTRAADGSAIKQVKLKNFLKT